MDSHFNPPSRQGSSGNLMPGEGSEDGMASGNEIPRRSFLGRVALSAGAIGLPAEVFRIAPAQAAASASGAGYTVRLAEYASQLRYDDIPTPVIRRIKDCITDSVAAILYGGKLPWSRIVIAHAQRTGPGGKSHILGTGGAAVQAPSAALAHGAMAHAFELDNLTDPDSGSHPGATMFSAGLAVAQESGGSGRDLIAAMTAGGEAMFRIGSATKQTTEPRGFQEPGTTGPLGG